jgi:hypothetical protein
MNVSVQLITAIQRLDMKLQVPTIFAKRLFIWGWRFLGEESREKLAM